MSLKHKHRPRENAGLTLQEKTEMKINPLTKAAIGLTVAGAAYVLVQKGRQTRVVFWDTSGAKLVREHD